MTKDTIRPINMPCVFLDCRRGPDDRAESDAGGARAGHRLSKRPPCPAPDSKARRPGTRAIRITHDALAEELGTAREASAACRRRWNTPAPVHLDRSRITILDERVLLDVGNGVSYPVA
jgi:hypothetical protein